jgi:hypothetical protein
MSHNSPTIGHLLKKKHMICCIVVVGLLLAGFFLYKTWKKSDSCGCKAAEGIQYAKRLKEKEGLSATYTVNSPALKAMFDKSVVKTGGNKMADQFDIMKTNSVAKTIDNKSKEEFQAAVRNREKFSNDYMPPQVMRASRNATPQSPFFGNINL